MLTLISGLPGSGKTTLAKSYADMFRVLHLNSDMLRNELGLMGHYRPTDKKKVYDLLLERARIALLAGKEVVVDSTFYKESIRAPFRQLAAACKAPLLWIEVCAKEAVIKQRLETPRPDSEADFADYEQIRKEYEPIPEPHLILWTDEMKLQEMSEAVREYVSQPSSAPDHDH